jgi:phage/plasmid primase-like uncharacterized protein
VEATSETYVKTQAVRDAVRGREEQVLHGIGIDWTGGRGHIECPYPDHGGKTDWRWDERKAKAYCTCSKGDSIFDVVRKCEGLPNFDAAKLKVAELIGRPDLILTKKGSHQRTDAASLLAPPKDRRDDGLPRAYLAFRLGTPAEAVLMPSTAAVGWTALRYVDPPRTPRGKPVEAGHWPCVVFEMLDAAGGRHAHRIYVEARGQGKAQLGTRKDGEPREAKKSARVAKGDTISGRCVLWGEPEHAEEILLAEGIETAAALAQAFEAEIRAGSVAVAAAVSANGIEAFRPWPATRKVVVAADRDEAPKANGKPASRQGERSARTFACKQHGKLPVLIAVPGLPGASTDWLDVFTAEGPDAVRRGVLGATAFEPTEAEIAAERERAAGAARLAEVERAYPLPRTASLKLFYRMLDGGHVRACKRVVKGEESFDIPIASPFSVPAQLRFADDGSFGLRIRLEDMRGEPASVDIERSEFARMGGSEIRALLYGMGLRAEASGESDVLVALKAAEPEHEIIAVRQPSWHDLGGEQIFVCPDGEIIGSARQPVELANPMAPEVARSGSLKGWQAAVNAAFAVVDCPHWALGVLAGFVGPVLALVGEDTCGINFSGMSSSGKTTAQRLAVSAWSSTSITKPGLFQSARATDNAVEALAQRATGTVLSLDELAHVSGKQAAKMIYTVAGGTGKRRLTSSAQMRISYAWTTFAVLSGECSLEEKVRADGGEWMAGMAVRIPDIDVTEVNRSVDAERLRAIGEIASHYGHAGPAFVRGLIQDGLHKQREEVLEQVLSCARALAGSGADGPRLRAARPFAFLAVAAEFAQGLGIIPEAADIRSPVRWAWGRFTRSSDALALNPEEQAIACLNAWIAERWNVTIKSVTGEAGLREAVAWYDDTAVYIPRERIRDAAGGSLKEVEIGALLHRRGALAKTKSDRHFSIGWVPQIGPLSAYALSRHHFGRTASDHEPEAFKSYAGGRP